MSFRTSRMLSDAASSAVIWVTSIGILPEVTRKLADADAAVAAGRQSVSSVDGFHRSLPLWQENLGNSLLLRHNISGNMDDLDEAISCFETALPAFEDPADRATCRANLGLARYFTFLDRVNERGFGGAKDDLSAAVEANEEALADPKLQPWDVVNASRNLATLYSLGSAWQKLPAPL